MYCKHYLIVHIDSRVIKFEKFYMFSSEHRKEIEKIPCSSKEGRKSRKWRKSDYSDYFTKTKHIFQK